MAEIRMCDQPGCKQPASLSYRWDWGQTGVCCQEHGLLLQQTAVNVSSHDLKRNINLAPLEHAQEAPLERSERTQLIAAKLAAEGEAAEIKRKSAELYQQNVNLTGQVSVLTLRNREANEQLTDARKTIDALEDKLHEREIDLGRVTDELLNLQTLAAFAPAKGKAPAPEPAKGKAPAPAPGEGKGAG